MNSSMLPLMVALPIACAVVLNLLHGRDRVIKYFILSCMLLFLILPFATLYGTHTFGGHIDGFYETDYSLGIVYLFQSHQRIIVFTLCLIAALVVLSYVGAYEKLSGAYLGFMMLGVGATSALLFADDFFNFYVFLEIALISQAALSIATGSLDAIKAAVKYLIVANVAGNCLLLGIAMLFSITGTLNVSDIQEVVFENKLVLLSNPVFMAACALSVFAFSYAGGIFPFHNIKSELYASAKPHASALMQTQTKFVMIALGLILLKLFSEVHVLRPIMLYMSLGAMVFGVIMALKQDDYHRMLSYHAISQAGYVASGISIGTPIAIVAGIFHAINHVLYKTALFIGCECVKYHKGTTKFESLGGALSSIPFVGFLVLGAKLAISGIPPFNGFQSKLMLLLAGLDSGLPEVSAIMILVSVLTYISMMKAFHMVYLRPSQQAENIEEDIPKTYVLALVLLVGLCVLIGFFPESVTGYIEPIAYDVGLIWR